MTISPLDLQVKAIGRSAAYAQNLRGAVRAFWNGTYNYVEFVNEFYRAIQRGFHDAWLEGAAQCGIEEADLTPAERNALLAATVGELAYVDPLASAIEQGSKANGGKLTPLLRRTELWVNHYTGIAQQAKAMACQDQKLVWVRHAMDSCSSCLKLEGRVYRASVWARYNIRPQASDLECMLGARGVPVCRCTFAVTSARVTPGRPPSIP